MPDYEIFRQFLEQAQAKGSKSTALTPLYVLTGILSASLASSFYAHAPPWAMVVLMCALTLCVIAYIGVYIYFAAKNPEYLRSEKFTLSKLAMEHSRLGDSEQGFVEAKDLKALDGPTEKILLEND